MLKNYFVSAGLLPGSKRKREVEKDSFGEYTHLESLKWVIEEVGPEQINGIMGKGSGLTSGGGGGLVKQRLVSTYHNQPHHLRCFCFCTAIVHSFTSLLFLLSCACP